MELKKSGMVALLGRPNVGKSTLMNKLVGEKVAIVTDKPQTTRRRLCAVATHGESQIVLVDTPGFHKPRSRLGEYMTRVTHESVAGVDAALLVVEPEPRVGKPEALLIERLRAEKVPVFLIVNKIDTVAQKDLLLPVIAAYRAVYDFAEIFPVSAKLGDGVSDLRAALAALMPEGPLLFPEGEVSDQTEREMISELIREQLLLHLDREVPHGTAVVVEQLSERPDGLIEIGAVIVCEKESHKGIIIGHKGKMLGEIGMKARLELEEMYEGKVNLKTWVRVRENWRDNPGQLRNFGYDMTK